MGHCTDNLQNNLKEKEENSLFSKEYDNLGIGLMDTQIYMIHEPFITVLASTRQYKRNWIRRIIAS